MSLFNKFISFFALTAIMLVGVMAIHSIKVDTLPIDRALGLVSRTSAPAFTLQARAQQSVYVTNCGGTCSSDATVVAIQAQRESISAAIGGIIAMVKATVKAVMKVLEMIKKIFSFFISLIQKFSGRDISLYGILSAVREISTLDNTFKDYFKGIQREFENIRTEFNGDITVSQANINSAARSTKDVSYVWDSCIAATLARDEGESPDGIDVDELCDLAVDGATNLRLALNSNSAASGAANSIFATQGISQDQNAAAANQALNGPTTSTESEGQGPVGFTGPLNALFAFDPDSRKYIDIEAKSDMVKAVQEAKDHKEAEKKKKDEEQKWASQCGLFVNKASEAALGSRATQAANSPVESGIFAAVGIGSSTPSSSLSFTGSTTSLSTSGTSTFLPSNVITGSAPDLTNASFDFAKIDKFDISALSPDKCSFAQDASKTAENAITQANQTTQPSETAGGISAVTNALQSIFDIIKAVQEIFQTITGFINELMQIGQSFLSQFQSFFGGLGNIFGGAGLGQAASGPGLGQALTVADIIKQNVGGAGLVAGASAQGPIDDGSVTVDDSAISANQENILRYSDQSVDCILDTVKIRSTSLTAVNKGSSASIDTNNLPVVGLNNMQTYTNGSNVPDGVMGTSINDVNTPSMGGITFKKSDGSTGPVPNIPSRSVITSGSQTGNVNATYHQCQTSPWGDDNSYDIAAQRLASYANDPKYGGPSPYRDGVTSDWRVVNNTMNKDIPEQCYLTNNDLTRSEKESIITSSGISANFTVINLEDNTSQFDNLWSQAKAKIDDAQRSGSVRWDSDPSLIYQARSRGGVIIGSGKDKKEIQIKPGKCEVSFSKDQVNAALQARGFSTQNPTILSFVALVK